MIMNSTGDRLWPTHQDQVKLGVTLMHQVPCVLVLVPLGKLLEVIGVILVPKIIFILWGSSSIKDIYNRKAKYSVKR